MKRFTLTLVLIVIATATFSPYASAQSASNSIAQASNDSLERKQNLIEFKPLSKPNNTSDSSQAEALITQGYELLKVEKYKEAIPYFTKALKIEPNNLTALFYRGACYYFTDEYKKSIADLNIVIKEAPDYANSYFFRGLSYASLGDKKKGNADLETAAKLFEKDGNPEQAKEVRDIIESINTF